MKKYLFNELKIGLSTKYKRKISNKIIDDYIKLSRDNSPIHTDKIFAKEKGFNNKIAHGLLLGSIYSKIIGVDLPGKNSLLLNIKIDFIKPIYANDTIITIAKIIHLNKSFKVATILFSAINQFKQKVSKAEANVKLNE
jgi:3-hydroxybutyryl-CoA dehydratase